jgi:hypothetical protein
METMKWDAEAMEALGVVLNYLEDEQRDFEEAGQPEGHIYRKVMMLRQRLEIGLQGLNQEGHNGKK